MRIVVEILYRIFQFLLLLFLVIVLGIYINKYFLLLSLPLVVIYSLYSYKNRLYDYTIEESDITILPYSILVKLGIMGSFYLLGSYILYNIR